MTKLQIKCVTAKLYQSNIECLSRSFCRCHNQSLILHPNFLKFRHSAMRNLAQIEFNRNDYNLPFLKYRGCGKDNRIVPILFKDGKASHCRATRLIFEQILSFRKTDQKFVFAEWFESTRNNTKSVKFSCLYVHPLLTFGSRVVFQKNNSDNLNRSKGVENL